MPRTEVPVTAGVLRWAVAEAGFSDAELATSVGVSTETLKAWVDGDETPGLTDFRKLASKLHRPLAFFLLPQPPVEQIPTSVQFRSHTGQARSLTPVERRYVRRAKRLQDVLVWLASEMRAPARVLAPRTVQDDADVVGTSIRQSLGVRVDEQFKWPSPSRAFDAWREALEAVGFAVFLFPMGKGSCSAFSLWHDAVPVIAVNTYWREEARIFSLFHELAHLVTRTSSACGSSVGGKRFDPVERWCERVAASTLLPAEAVRQSLPLSLRQGPIDDLKVTSGLASRFKVSLRAATLRVIEMRLAKWDLYEDIPPVSDAKTPGGRGGGRNRTAIKEDEVGGRGIRLLVDGVRRDLLSRSQALDYLDIPDQAFDQLAG